MNVGWSGNSLTTSTIMKYIVQTLVVLVGLCGAQALFAQDPVKISPDKYRVILHHKQVRVLDVRIKPGAKSPMHSHPDNVLYVLRGGTARFTDDKGKTTEVTLKTGECQFREDGKHEVENIGKTEIHVLNIELD